MANMMVLKPKVVIIGAGVSGLAAANKLYTIAGSKLQICVVEGGTRIGGRINTSELGGDRIEMGATWIHGINGSPIYQIAQEINSLHCQQPWERMDGFPENPVTLAEGGFEIDSDILSSITRLFRNLSNISQGKHVQEKGEFQNCSRACGSDDELEKLSVGSFLRKGLDAYWDSVKKDEGDGIKFHGKWTRKSLEEAIFAMYENIHRGYTAAGDLFSLDFAAEREYQTFPGLEITIAKGYTSVIQSLASVLPPDSIQLNRKVVKIEWKEDEHPCLEAENMTGNRPVKLHFCNGSIMQADHVIVTVSLGVLKAGIQANASLFHPPLPASKSEAISRLGFGIVDKLFLQLTSTLDQDDDTFGEFPNLHMVFHPFDSELREEKIPWWIRKSASLAPIYHNSSVLLCWFVGEEALELEKLNDEEVINVVSTTISSFLHEKTGMKSREQCNGKEITFSKIMKSQWGTDPLFLGSYTYVAVGSNVNDFDLIAEPLPNLSPSDSSPCPPPLQILFAGEATHRTHYSTTHGAYLSGLREANRLLELYHYGGL